MKLKGGVIIIGSLIWEDHLEDDKKDNIRKNWRIQNLLEKQKIQTKVPIRYGRKSSTRFDTYSMVFSKTCETTLGQGLILPFNKDIITFEEIKRQAFALAYAEGIYKKKESLTSKWGSVGLLINPQLINTDSATCELVKMKWKDIYSNYQATFLASNYRINDDEESVITQNGFLNISWQKEMDAFDILIATPVIPKPNQILTSEEIADKMIEKKYCTYFKQNRENNIKTYQDDEILNHLPN
ncbi:MAG TPA: hypothetical protein VF411_14415 [Bacteroidia bacterium]